jgi:hypothetical protein
MYTIDSISNIQILSYETKNTLPDRDIIDSLQHHSLRKKRSAKTAIITFYLQQGRLSNKIIL